MERASSIIPTASLVGTEVSVDEMRSATASSDRYYPPSLHAPLISSPEPDPNEQALIYQGKYGGDYGGMSNEFQSVTLNKEHYQAHAHAFPLSPTHKWYYVVLFRTLRDMNEQVTLQTNASYETDGVNGQGNRWLNGHATFYGANQSPTTLGGACGYDNTFHAGFGINTAAVSGVLFGGGEACGACYQLMCDYNLDPKWCLRRAVTTITATNFCPPNNNGGWCNLPRKHFDMSMPAFFRIARQGNEGIVPVPYRRVACRRKGGVRFTLKGQSNFNMIMISNVGGSGDVRAAWLRSSRTRTWVGMHRNWGANWQSNVDLRTQTVSFKLMLADGKTSEFFNVVPSSWKFGQTFASQNQFT
ncbi:unnamed protein product [Camellia sinensis]